MNYYVESIEEYLDVIPNDRKDILLKLISIMKEYFPDIGGNMKYNMPTYEPVCAMASQKNYVSFYIYKHNLINQHRKELGNLRVGKSCIRFNKMEQMPENTIRAILYEVKNIKL